MALNTNLTINHDYLTLRVSFTKESRVNLTITRRGVKGSATVDLLPHFDLIVNTFNHAWKTSKFESNLEFLETIKAMADRCATPQEFISKMIKGSMSETIVETPVGKYDHLYAPGMTADEKRKIRAKARREAKS